MEMHQVRYFLAAAKHLNFTRAAEELHVAQPSLTRAIQKLELELDGPLFRRERSHTHLTELGRMILPHLQATLSAAETAKAQARRLKKNENGSLALGLDLGAEAGDATALLIEATQIAVGLDLTIETASTESVEARLMAGEFDAAILAPIGERNDRFDAHLIRDEGLVVAFVAGHRFASVETVALEALDAEPLVVRLGCCYEHALAAAMDARGLTRTVRHRSNDLRWVAEFVRNGLGCAIMPKTAAQVHGLSHCVLDDLTLRHRTVLATVAGRRHSAALATLIRGVFMATHK